MAKEITVAFRQKGEKQETAEARVNEAFDILFMEVMKRMEKRKSDKSYYKNISAEGGEYLWAN